MADANMLAQAAVEGRLETRADEAERGERETDPPECRVLD